MPTAPAVVCSRLVVEVARSRSVVVPVAKLAEALGIDREAAWRLAGEAERAGEINRWPAAPGGPGVVLTPLAAERLKLRPCGESERWRHPGDLDPARKNPTVRQLKGGPESLDLARHDRAG